MKLIFCDNTLWGLVNFRGEVIRHFANQGHEVVLVAPEKEDEQMRTTIPDGVRYIPVDMGRTSMNPINDVKYFFRMLRIFRRERPDYVFTYTIKPNIYGTIAARLIGCHCTAMMAGLGFIFINDTTVTRLARSLYRFGLRFTDHLLVLNRYNQRLVEERHICTPSKVTLLEGGEGINLDHFPMTDNEDSRVTFLYIGRILWDKGYEELSQAAAHTAELAVALAFIQFLIHYSTPFFSWTGCTMSFTPSMRSTVAFTPGSTGGSFSFSLRAVQIWPPTRT